MILRRIVLAAGAIMAGALAPAGAQTVGTGTFPVLDPPLSRFYEDAHVERLDGYLQGIANAPKEWGDYPPVAGFFAAQFQRHPDWIGRLVPVRLDAKTADTVAAALRLSGQPSVAPPLRARLAEAGHDPRLGQEFAGLPTALDGIRIATPTYMDILWGAFFATGDMRYVRPILDFYARTADRSDAISIDIAKVTVAMNGGNKEIFNQLKGKYEQPTLRAVVYASTAQTGLIANARNLLPVRQLLTTYVSEHRQAPSAKGLEAFLKRM